MKVKFVVKKDFQEVRCECGALLYKCLNKSVNLGIEIKCRKCGKILVR